MTITVSDNKSAVQDWTELATTIVLALLLETLHNMQVEPMAKLVVLQHNDLLSEAATVRAKLFAAIQQVDAPDAADVSQHISTVL